MARWSKKDEKELLELIKSINFELLTKEKEEYLESFFNKKIETIKRKARELMKPNLDEATRLFLKEILKDLKRIKSS